MDAFIYTVIQFAVEGNQHWIFGDNANNNININININIRELKHSNINIMADIYNCFAVIPKMWLSNTS